MNRLFLLVLASLVLGACGGGDDNDSDSGSPQPPAATALTITTENSPEVSATVTDSTINGELPGATELLGALATGPANLDVAGLSKATSANELNSMLSSLAVENGTEECSGGGTVTITANLANQGTFTNGDRFALDFDNCSESGVLIDGVISMTVSAFASMPDSGEFELGLTVLFDNYRIDSEEGSSLINGDVSMEIDASNESIGTKQSSTSLSLVINDNDILSLENYSYETIIELQTLDYSTRASGSLTSPELGGTVTFETLQPFEGSAGGLPTSGEMLIIGAEGGSILLTVLPSGDVQLEVDIDGDDIVDETIITTWLDLEDLVDD